VFVVDAFPVTDRTLRAAGASAWAMPITFLVWSALWLIAVFAGIDLGIRANGVRETELGGAGPDIYDVASGEISTFVIGLSLLVLAAGGTALALVYRRFGFRTPGSVGELVGTTLIWLGAGLVALLALLVFLIFGVL
jgi:hypothetical protein